MLKNRFSQLLMKQIEEQEQQQKTANIKLEFYPDEIDYIETHNLISEDLTAKIALVENNHDARFLDAYIERCDKETEDSVSQENSAFLNQPLHFLKKHKNEFIYLESQWFDLVGVDGLSLESDDVFGTYDVMLGLKLQKKLQSSLREQLNSRLAGEEPKFDLVFNNEDGLWDFNFTLNYVDGFSEELLIGEALQIIYRFLFNVVAKVEKTEHK